MVTTVVGTSATTTGRHRLGLPGLVHVRAFAVVSERSLLSRLLGVGRRWGRHHDHTVRPTAAARDTSGRLVPATLA